MDYVGILKYVDKNLGIYIFSVMNLKGGIGKSIIVINVVMGIVLVFKDRKCVVIIDFDL